MLRKYYPHYLELLKLGIPLVLTQAGQMTVQLIDNAMIGRSGTAALAASSFANNIYIVLMLLGLGIFLGITPLVGHARGANDDRQVAATMKSAFTLAVLLIPGIALAAWSISWAIPHMGQTDEVVRLAVPYYRTLVVATIPFLFFVLLKQIGEGLGNTLVAMVATLVANLLKVALNYALIFGKFGFPELGLLGAGYATIISRTVMLLLLYAGFMHLHSIKHYFALMHATRAAWVEVTKFLKIGLPIAVQLVLEVSSFALSAVMMGWMGNVPLAAHEIAIGLASFTFMIANGVSMAATIRVSYELGKRNYRAMEQISYSAAHLVLSYMGLCGLGFLLLRHRLPFIFTTDTRVIKQAAALLAVAALFQLFDGLQTVSLGILRGFADVKAPMLISVFSYMVFGLSVSYLCAFSFRMGPVGIWYGFLVGLLVAGILLALRIRNRIKGMNAAFQ
jgi:multidrug resistance protein, MATE family